MGFSFFGFILILITTVSALDSNADREMLDAVALWGLYFVVIGRFTHLLSEIRDNLKK